ncbi:MAG TPA: hypothetical protein VGE38_08260, partial [Nocardioides sp.]|uniref:hypothetical protein n=1 Tax=Nocardioides sp. TaxID=35761 RepID=UPI002ED9504C
TARSARPRRSAAERVGGWLDWCHERFDTLVQRIPGDARPVVEWARPLWWLARAGIAALIAAGLLGASAASLTFAVILVPAVVGSVLIGVGKLWPGGRRGLLPRLLLLALNSFAIVMLPVVASYLDQQADSRYWDGYNDAQADSLPTVDGAGYGIDEQAGLYSSGRWVTNVFPYDASGRPLVGVQLFDQNGDPINVVAAPECPDGAGGWTVVTVDPMCWDPMTGEQGAEGRVPYPWTNGAAQLENVFPLPTRMQAELQPSATAFAEPDPPAMGQFPLASVPPVSLPGITPSVVQPPDTADSQAERAQG